jgi:uncharacterized membrane protein
MQNAPASKPLNPRLDGFLRTALGMGFAALIVFIAGKDFWPSILAWLGQTELQVHWPEVSRLAKLNAQTQVHIGSALISLGLGPFILWRRKGDTPHKVLGYIWVAAMITTCGSSFFMKSFAPMLGQFGPIHVLSVWTLYSIPSAIVSARAGNIEKHQGQMKGVYYGLVFAGLMTFIPGRTMFALFFQ